MYKLNVLSAIGVALFSTLFLSNCKHDSYETAPTGLKYWFLKDDEGKVAQQGDIVEMHVKYSTSSDSVLFNSFTQPKPIVMEVPASPFKGSFEEAITMMSPGDSAQFLIAADSIFRKEFGAVRPPFIDSGSYLTFTVKLLKADKKEDYIAKQEKERVGRAANQKSVDDKIISEYVSQNGLKPTKTETGLYIIETQVGKGVLPVKGDTVSVHYTGRTLDGKIFDTSRKEDGGQGAPFDFILGVTPIIQGWQEGVSLLKSGSKATLLVPSTLAYGEQATPKFGPNSVLTFDVEIVKVIKPKK